MEFWNHKESELRILLTNDDGYGAPGLMALEETLGKEHDVWVLAPLEDRSGCSQSLTLTEKMVLTKHTEKHYSLSGNPADCVILSSAMEFIPKPDLVVAGINKGPNLGTDVVFSGTAAGARQAVLMGIPGMALSYASYTVEGDYTSMAEVFTSEFPAWVKKIPENCFLNINFPEDFHGENPWEFATPAPRRYNDWVKIHSSSQRQWTVTMAGQLEKYEPSPGTDWQRVNEGSVSLSYFPVEPVSQNPAEGSLQEGT